MDKIFAVVECNLFRQHDDGSFAGTIGRSSSVRYKALDGGGVDNQTSALVDLLLFQHLLQYIFATKKDAFRVDVHRAVVVFFVGFVYTKRSDVRRLNADAGVVGHDIDPVCRERQNDKKMALI